MIEQENLVTEQVAENVEHTTEQTPKTYTEAEFNAKLDEVLGKKIARREAKIRKEYDRRYGELEEVLKAGMGKEDVGEITSDLREFYGKQKGIKMPEKPKYNAQDMEVLARADAAEIINAGEVTEELDRLSELGVKNMSEREKAMFKVLVEHHQNSERAKELNKIGVSEEVYESKEFKEFASKFNSNISIQDIYGIYAKTNAKNIKPMGSMKNSTSEDGTVKDFYTIEEARQFTKKDFDKNPALFKAVEASMLKWKK